MSTHLARRENRLLAALSATICLGTTIPAGAHALARPTAGTATTEPSARTSVPVTAATDSHVTRLILLGTGGGPIPRKLRSQPASLLVIDGRPYLIDAGAGVVRQLAWAGFEPHEIGTIFFTHLHFDHEAGLEPLMSFIWMDRNMHRMFSAHPVQIYGPPATRYLVHAALNYLSVSERIFLSELPGGPAAPMFQAHRFDRDGVVYRDHGVCVTAVQNTHYRFKPETPAYKAGDQSYAYRFDTPAGSVVFTGDTGPSQAVTRLAEGADVLVSEVIDEAAMARFGNRQAPLPPQADRQRSFHMLHEHLSPQEVGKMAAQAHVRMVVLTHIVPGLDNETDTSAYTEGVEKHYSGPVVAGKDLFEYDLTGRTSTADACGGK